MGARLLRAEEVLAVRGDEERRGAAQPRRAQQEDQIGRTEAAGAVRAHRVCRTRLQPPPLNIDEGGAGRVQPAVFAAEAAGVQRGHRDAPEEHV